jgi:acyl-CoA synthetase (AMP-forming)/AMP-acid ligase II
MIRTPKIETLCDLYLRSTQWCGVADLFVDERFRISGRDALDASLRLATAYHEMGSRPGDVVAFLCRPSARHAAAWFAAPLSGRVACNLHTRETPQKISQILTWLDAAVLVHDEDMDDLAMAAIELSGRSVRRLSLGRRGEAAACYDDVIASGHPFDVLAQPPRPDDAAAIVLSSGTTGQPKGITHTQKTLLETAKGGQFAYGPITPRSVTLLYMQPSFAAWAIITLPFVGGKSRIVYGGKFTPQAFLEACQRERVTVASLGPTMWRMVFEAGPEAYDLSALEIATMSGEAPAPSDVERLRRSFCKGVSCLYLSSEAFTGSAVVATTPDLVQLGKIGSSGRPGVGVDVKIIDPGGTFDDELPDGEVGEIAISGPSTAIGYWKDDALTAARFRDGWWRSGDLGRLDEDGFLWVIGRIDNVINTGGIKVSGEEIEQALLSHPAIIQCAVVGQRDDRFGQRIEAFCVPRGDAPSVEELDRFLRNTCGLAGFKIPKTFHFRPELPTTATGKLYRRGLITGTGGSST